MTYLLFKGQEIGLMGKVLAFLMKSEVVFVPNQTMVSKCNWLMIMELWISEKKKYHFKCFSSFPFPDQVGGKGQRICFQKHC